MIKTDYKIKEECWVLSAHGNYLSPAFIASEPFLNSRGDITYEVYLIEVNQTTRRVHWLIYDTVSTTNNTDVNIAAKRHLRNAIANKKENIIEDVHLVFSSLSFEKQLDMVNAMQKAL
jgi:hypothetical protein